MTTYTTKKAAALAQRLADQEAENRRLLAAIQAEQDAHDARLAKALADAGPARVALVEDLLDKLGIDSVPHEAQVHKRTGEVVTDKSGKPRMIDPDPHEEQRMQLLAEAIDRLIEGSADQVEDSGDRDLDEVIATVQLDASEQESVSVEDDAGDDSQEPVQSWSAA
ncbi:hypothetical protein [Nostocoides vanveenii]|uniref:Uncharacterized protein n=1 Tax=Nostocoides vanveenii TaxID=330835 RepID=A0ABN2KXT6_9MICO